MGIFRQLGACGVAVLASLSASAVTISNVTVRAVSPWTGLYEISYALDADVVPTQPNGHLLQTVTVRDEASGTCLVMTNSPAEAALFPSRPSYAAGAHRLVWTPEDPSRVPARATVEVAIRETTTPLPYCVVDLSGGTSAAKHPVSYLDDVPAGGWTDAYKTDYLVLRLVQPGTFTMGDQVHDGLSYPVFPDITLTRPYYIAIFETTEGQWARMGGSDVSADSTRPATDVAFVEVRGSRNGVKWPESADIDAGNSAKLSGLRTRTGLLFDLPTEAQWEYAARAGTSTDYGNGTDWTDSAEDPAMDAVGRYLFNAPDGLLKTAPVGSYAPNAWGLYDMHGNVWELCLDRWSAMLESPAVDPVGSATASFRTRVTRGGSYESWAEDCTSAARVRQDCQTRNESVGFRLVFPAGTATEETVCQGASPVADLATDRRDPLPVGGEPLPLDFDPLYARVDPSDDAYTVRVTLDGAETLVETNGFGRLEGWTAHWYTNVLRHVVLRGGVEIGTPLVRTLVSTLGPDSLTLGECVNEPRLEFTVGGTGGWSRDTVTNMDGVVSLRSRDTGLEGETWLETTVVGPGTLSFWWKSEGEVGRRNELYDYMEFRVDGIRRQVLGLGDWAFVTLEVKGEGAHVLRWIYRKDDYDDAGDPRGDCGWLDRVSWSGAVPGPPRDETETTPVPVTYAWLDQYPSILAAADGDYEAAANAPTDKRDAAGNPMHVWQDFVAGTDPTDPADFLRAFIRMENGRPVVTWTPDLGEARRYRLWGAAAPTGPWTERSEPDASDRFFKVCVEMP